MKMPMNDDVEIGCAQSVYLEIQFNSAIRNEKKRKCHIQNCSVGMLLPKLQCTRWYRCDICVIHVVFVAKNFKTLAWKKWILFRHVVSTSHWPFNITIETIQLSIEFHMAIDAPWTVNNVDHGGFVTQYTACWISYYHFPHLETKFVLLLCIVYNVIQNIRSFRFTTVHNYSENASKSFSFVRC